MRFASWVGLVLSLFLIYAAVWFHYNLEEIIRIPFVFIFGGGGVMLGLTSFIYLIKGQLTGINGPFS